MKGKKMFGRMGVLLLALALALSACQFTPPPPPVAQSSLSEVGSVEGKIANAMMAAAAPVSQNATILDWPTTPGGEFVELRKGSNRWYCFPADDKLPADVGKPMCMDDVWLTFMKVRLAGGKLERVTAPGVAYMLAGGGGPSSTDPYATEPAPGQDWTKDAPPHLMILVPGDLSAYLTTPGPEPWVMFSGTSFDHLMVAVPPPAAPSSSAEVGSVEWKIANAMMAAGPPISAEATILDWPAEAGGEFRLLREGSNRWTCFPADDKIPADVGKPMCMDDVWLAFMKVRLAGGKLEPVTAPGVAYMLAGGGGSGSTDPYATEPAPGEDWIKDAPPHLMILVPGDLSAYPATPGPEPWVMFAGTSFDHLMINVPVVPAK